MRIISLWDPVQSDRLTVGLGTKASERSKLDWDRFLVFVPLLVVYFLSLRFENLVPETYWKPASDFIAVALLAVGCIVLQRQYRPSLKQFGLDRSALASGTVRRWTLVACFIPLGSYALREAASALLQQNTALLPPVNPYAQTFSSCADLLSEVIFVVFLSPITEEFLFRGYLYLVARQNWGSLAAALISAGAFSLIHLPAGPLIFLYSLLYVYFNNRAGSLLPSITGHVLWNGRFLVLPP